MTFRVTPESLFEAASAVRATLPIVGDWGRAKLDLVAAAPAAGHPAMADAIDQFCGEWDYGFGHIADDLEEIARALEIAAITYSDTDGAIAAASGAGE